MSKKSRLLALVLVLVMMLGVIPVTAFAQNDAQAVAEENTLDKTVLEQLADKATGDPYEMSSSGGLTFGNYDIVVNDGKFTSAGYVGTGTGGPNAGKQHFYHSDDKGVSFVDKTASLNDDITFGYTKFSTNFNMYNSNGQIVVRTKYVVFQANVMRGENGTNGQTFLRLRFKDDLGTTYEYAIGIFNGEDLKIYDTNAGGFSTTLWTNIAGVYDVKANKLDLYANGIHIKTVNNLVTLREKVINQETGEKKMGSFISMFNDISLYNYKTNNFSGRYISVKETRAYLLVNDSQIAKIVNADATPANGVFKINGDYYLFENNFPVVGGTRTVDGYTITTEAKTGKIVKCVKADATLYKAWTSAQFAENGVTLTTNGYATNLTGNAYEYYGYKYTTTTENGTTYYILDTEKTLVRRPHYAGANTGDGYEFTYMDAQNNRNYYDAIPADATEIKDASGKLTGYKTATAPATAQKEGNDLSYYTDLTSGRSFGTGTTTVNFALKAGEGIVTGRNLVRFRYRVNGSGSAVNYEKVKANNKDGALHLYINDIDCGIFRSDIYTYISFVLHLDGTTLKNDIYVNGVRVAQDVTVAEGVNNYITHAVGVWQSPTFSKPYITWGTAQAYTGAKVDVNTNPYTGTVAGANGVYTYTNGLCTGFTKNATVDGTVALKSYSMTAGDTLGLNFYVNKSNATKAIITVDGEKQTVDLTKLSPEADGTYKVSAKISSINLANKITLAFYNGNELLDIVTSTGDVTNYYITSAKDYANAIIIRRYYYGEDIYNAARAMLNYAAYAENYFTNTSFSSVANTTADYLSVTAVNVADIKGTVSAGAGASEILGNVNLILNNATKIRVQLKGAANFSSEFENITYVEKDGKYYVDIDGITATNLDKVYSFTVNGIEVNVSVLGVAAVVANNEASYGKDFVNLMKALYLYSVACEKLA